MLRYLSCTYSSVSLAKTDFSKYSQYFLKNYLYINHFTCEYDYLTSYMSTSRKAGVSIYGMYVIIFATVVNVHSYKENKSREVQRALKY